MKLPLLTTVTPWMRTSGGYHQGLWSLRLFDCLGGVKTGWML